MSTLRRALRELGHVVDGPFGIDEGVLAAGDMDYDLIIVDVRGPPHTWLPALPVFRRNSRAPVLTLGNPHVLEDRIQALRAGADAHLELPFVFSELSERIHALVRTRTARKANGSLKLADLEVDLAKRQALRMGTSLRLTAQQFILLAIFIRHQGEVLTRDRVTELLWDRSFESDGNVVDVAVTRLRAKLDGPFKRKLLHTVRGVGYVLEART